MKKLSENRTLALIALIAAALLAVPLLGGLGLRTAERKAAKEFSKIAATADDHGNDLFSDTDMLMDAASALLDEGRRLKADGGSEFEKWAGELENAIESCRAQKDAIGRYRSCESLALTARRFYGRIKSVESSELEACMSRLEERNDVIKRAYRYEYNDYLAKCDALTAKWPASMVAKLFGMGGVDR